MLHRRTGSERTGYLSESALWSGLRPDVAIGEQLMFAGNAKTAKYIHNETEGLPYRRNWRKTIRIPGAGSKSRC